MPLLAQNKKANFDYQILETYEAGLVLFGHEVKAARAGQVSLKGSFISVRTKNGQPELYLLNCQISPYKQAGPLPDYNQHRERKLLMKRQEISHLLGKKQAEGLTLIPLKLYTNHSFLKLEFAVAKGKKKYDKRDSYQKTRRRPANQVINKKEIGLLGMQGIDSRTFFWIFRTRLAIRVKLAKKHKCQNGKSVYLGLPELRSSYGLINTP